MRRTKIVCTLGPSSNSRAVVEQLIYAGMDVARFNFSHGSYDDHRAMYATLRNAADALGANVAVLMDLQGPKIRTGKLEGGKPVTLADGAQVVVTTEPIPGTAKKISTGYEHLPQDVKPGDRILIADGTLELVVDSVKPPEVFCSVVHGGLLGEKKGINLPGVNVTAAALTEKDIEDLKFGLELGVDFVALSFVRSADDIRRLKKLIAELGKSTPVVAKIEREEALRCFDEILTETDAVMVARGDLGVEVELYRVPQIQKTLIRLCNENGKPVITATQMLESMVSNSRPTRAEAADVANAIYDGTDAVMLSGETANGQYPVEAVQVMARIAATADESISKSYRDEIQNPSRKRVVGDIGFRDAVGQAVVRMSQVTVIKRIIVLTKSGYSAVAVSRYRPNTPIIAVTLSEIARRRCALFWGVDAIGPVEVLETSEMINVIDETLTSRNLAHAGDAIAIVAGTPLGTGGRTNLIQLHRIGEHHKL